MIEQIPPGLLLIVAGLLVPVLPRYARKAVLVVVPAIGAAHLWSLPLGTDVFLSVFDYELHVVRVDSLARIFGLIFHLAAVLSGLYAAHNDDRVQQVAALTYSGAAIAAVFAGDLLTLFIFWEGTAVTSVFLIWARRTERAYRTGMRYLIIQVLSGVLLLAGALLIFSETGSLAFGTEAKPHGMFAFDSLGSAPVGVLLVFVSFGIKAAFPLLHNWLQDAYPEATVTGTVWLSAFTTKLAIYALARGFAGTDILITIGAIMTAFPIFYAVIENDLRRVLAYSLNNQLGYMVVGVGIGTPLALNGAASHAFAHILYKGLLFMGMGAVLYRAGTVKGSELGGLWRSMPLTMVFTSIGAAAISAFPLFSGFVSKSMILTAAAEGHYTVVFLVLLFASAGVFHHSGIKIPYFAFFAHDSGKRVEEAPKNMLAAMAIAAFLCVAIGCYPQPLYDLLPYDMGKLGWIPYDVTHVVTTLQLLLFSAVAFVFLQKTGLYPPELRSVVVDFDWTYRKLGVGVVRWVWWFGGHARAWLGGLVRAGLDRTVGFVADHHRPGGAMGEPWPTGSAALWAALLLYAYLMLAYL